MNKVAEPKDLRASIQGRLRNIARTEEISYNLIMLLYCQERLLYRLSISSYSSKFILKGGLLLFSITGFKSRPTKDVDFLAQNISNDVDQLKQVFEQICRVSYPDGVLFDSASIEVNTISERGQYNGARIKLTAFVGNIRQQLQVDIGFGDIVIPKPKTMKYPTLLNNLSNPHIQVYSLESVIAEKFEAMVRLSLINSRMKDFYDIFTLLRKYDFEGRVLQESVANTFSRRGTTVEREHILFSGGFATDSQRNARWVAFVTRTGLEDLSFQIVMQGITTFLSPIYEAIVNENEFFKNWNHQLLMWE